MDNTGMLIVILGILILVAIVMLIAKAIGFDKLILKIKDWLYLRIER